MSDSLLDVSSVIKSFSPSLPPFYSVSPSPIPPSFLGIYRNFERERDARYAQETLCAILTFYGGFRIKKRNPIKRNIMRPIYGKYSRYRKINEDREERRLAKSHTLVK